MSTDSNIPESASNVGVVNPYALVELIRSQPVDWAEMDHRQVFEETFDRPYEDLFDPQYGSPLYPGVELTDEGVIQRVAPSDEDLDFEDAPIRRDPDLSDVRTVRDLADRMGVEDPGALEARRLRVTTSGSVTAEIVQPQPERPDRSLEALPRETIEYVTDLGGASEGWTPSGAGWSDPGDFFSETAEWFDPIQGSVANCYYIAALAAVGWSKPFRIQHRTRATGSGQQEFVDMIQFHNGGSTTEIEVSEEIPLRNGNPIYARSRERDEIWPAVYEKAFAKKVTGTGGDKPNITKTAYGNCVAATDRLVGGSQSYTLTKNNSAGDLWSEVRSHSRSYKTFDPGTAWTYSSGSSAPNSISYSNANIVANHCYAVLGWDYDNGTKYIALYNVWGRTEPSIGRMNGVWTPHDESFWRRVNLPSNDGTFAIEASTFKKYFAGLGFVN